MATASENRNFLYENLKTSSDVHKVINRVREPTLIYLQCECVDTTLLPFSGKEKRAQVKYSKLEIIQPNF